MTPLDPIGGTVSGLASEAWRTAMFGLWDAGLWLLGVILQLQDALLTPDLRADGPSAAAYRLTYWIAAGLAVLMLVAQLLITLLRRDARSLGAALLGCAKFVVVWAAWLGWCTAVVSGVAGLTRATLGSLLHVHRWQDVPLLGPQLDVERQVDTAVATTLGLLGLVLWLAALGHVLIMLGRAVGLLVLAATTPIAAAGLVGELGRGWFWKSVRWFHAAALTPLLIALMVGLGAQTTAGVGEGLAEGPVRAVGSAIPGVLVMLVSCLAPVALFKLLAFVDPNTPTGEGLRRSLESTAQTLLMLRAGGAFPSPEGQNAAETVGGSAGAVSGPDAGSTWAGTGSDASAERRDLAEHQLTSGGQPTQVSSGGARGLDGPVGEGDSWATGGQPADLDDGGPGGGAPRAGMSSATCGPGGSVATVGGEAAAVPVVPV